jgi:hypothetical protein
MVWPAQPPLILFINSSCEKVTLFGYFVSVLLAALLVAGIVAAAKNNVAAIRDFNVEFVGFIFFVGIYLVKIKQYSRFSKLNSVASGVDRLALCGEIIAQMAIFSVPYI